jgi:hypothetical protein
MKTFVKVLMPVVAFALASAGAVSTNSPKASDARSGAIPAFIQNPSSTSCVTVTANCSTNNTHQACMSIEQPTKKAYLKNASGACAVELWRVL